MRNILLISNNGYEIYTSLKPVFRDYPQFEVEKNRVYNCFSRLKENVYTIGDVTILRLDVKT